MSRIPHVKREGTNSKHYSKRLKVEGIDVVPAEMRSWHDIQFRELIAL